ncbi:MAG: hypothetical protein WBV94_02335, partial [Blastocatellia bacterium]
TDLLGIVSVDLNMPQKARISIRAWINNLATQKEDPVITELVMERARLRKELEETKDQLTFEQQKAKDLQSLMAREGGTDFDDLSTDPHWKLLFDYNYFWIVVSIITKAFNSPQSWRNELERIGIAEVVNRIQWDQLKNLDRTHLYVAKSMRVFRQFESAGYQKFLDHTDKSLRVSIESIEKQRTAILQTP